MRFLRIAIAALAAVGSVGAAQSTPAGAWKAVFVGPPAARPKVPSFFEITLQQTSQGMSGTVHADKWPHDGLISDATIDGNHVTFTSVMKDGWWGTGSGGERIDHCCPKLIFDGTVVGGKMTLTLKWSSTEVADGSGPTYPMEATRTSR